MNLGTRSAIVAQLAVAFGGAEDVTPAVEQPLHVLLTQIELPEPWTPSLARAVTVWSNWPEERPRFLLDARVVGASGAPPRNPSPCYLLGETWNGFSFAFSWVGDDPVRAVQLWLTRFDREQD